MTLYSITTHIVHRGKNEWNSKISLCLTSRDWHFRVEASWTIDSDALESGGMEC